MEASAVQIIAGLAQLPHSVVAVILRHLIGGTAPLIPGSGSGAGGSGTASSAGGGEAGGGAGRSGSTGGSPKALVQLAFCSKAMIQAVEAADDIWQEQCIRMGWSLEWLATLPMGTSSWQYFCWRMAVRHRLRRQLRALSRFLDPISAAAMRPGAAVWQLTEVEAALQMPLPWELFELYRFCDGQECERGGLQFLDAARLLSLHEMRQAVQDQHGPLETHRAFQQQLLQSCTSRDTGRGSSVGGGDCTAAAGSNSGSSGNSDSSMLCGGCRKLAGPSSGGSTSAGSSASPAQVLGTLPAADAQQPAEPAVLLPFTDELRGRKRYCMDVQGRVWLASGFNTLFMAPSLSALIPRVLT